MNDNEQLKPGNLEDLQKPVKAKPAVAPAFQPIVDKFYDPSNAGKWFEHVRREQIDHIIERECALIDELGSNIIDLAAKNKTISANMTKLINKYRAARGMEPLK